MKNLRTHSPWLVHHPGKYIAVLATMALFFTGLVGIQPALAAEPFTLTWTRNDTLGDTVYAGDTLKWRVSIENKTGKTVAAVPVETNLARVAWPYQAPGVCGFAEFAAGATKECTYIEHDVTEEDVAKGVFTPFIRYQAKTPGSAVAVIAEGAKLTGPDVVVKQGTRANPVQPVEVTWTRTDTLGDEVYAGETLTYDIAVKNNGTKPAALGVKLTNLENVNTPSHPGPLSCHFAQVPPGETRNCQLLKHEVVAADVTAKQFTPFIRYASTVDDNGTPVTTEGAKLVTHPVTVKGGTRANPTPPPAYPFAITLNRSDSFGDKAKVGDVLTWTVRIRNNGNASYGAKPVDTNLERVFWPSDPFCAFYGMPPGRVGECFILSHTVTDEDIAAKSFTPFVTFDAVEHKATVKTIVAGKKVMADPVPLTAQAPPPPAPTAPYTVAWERTDTLGDKVYVGEELTWTLTITNVSAKAFVIRPDESNVDGIKTATTEGTWKSAYLPAGVPSKVKVSHVVTDADVAAKSFTPRVKFHTSKSFSDKTVIYQGQGSPGTAVVVGAGTRPGTPPPPSPLPGEPFTIEWKRLDAHGDHVHKGDELKWELTVTNNAAQAVTAFPVEANVAGVLTSETKNCRYEALAAGKHFHCDWVTHVVTDADVAAKSFTPFVRYNATADRAGTQVLQEGKKAAGPVVSVEDHTHPPAPAVPYTVAWKRTDTLGDKVYVGEKLTWTLTITNVSTTRFAVKPDASNVDGIKTATSTGTWKAASLPPGTSSEVKVSHVVTAADVAAKQFTPQVRFHTASETWKDDVLTPPKDFPGAAVVVGAGTRPGTTPPPPPPAPPVVPGPVPPPAPSPTPTPTPTPTTTPAPITPGNTLEIARVSGPSRVETAVALAKADFKESAPVIVIARADVHADSVSAVPLADELRAPILLTQPDSLHPAVAEEVKRLQPKGGRVIIMGGEVAISKAVEDALVKLGAKTERVAGANRAATAVDAAKALTKMNKAKYVLVADGAAWEASLIAGPAAASIDGVTLLTNGDAMAPETVAYLKEVNVPLTVIGAKAKQALPGKRTIEGKDPTDLSLAVAKGFFAKPTAFGLATTDDFADALTGGVHIGRKHGPLILTPNARNIALKTWVKATPSLVDAFVYGGEARISNDLLAELKP